MDFRFSYNYITEDDVAYICVATMDIPTRLCFGFLTKVKSLYDGGEEFESVLEEQMVRIDRVGCLEGMLTFSSITVLLQQRS